MTDIPWSPARETRARCNGGCKPYRDFHGWFMVVDASNPYYVERCPRCKGSGFEPSPDRQQFPEAA